MLSARPESDTGMFRTKKNSENPDPDGSQAIKRIQMNIGRIKEVKDYHIAKIRWPALKGEHEVFIRANREKGDDDKRPDLIIFQDRERIGELRISTSKQGNLTWMGRIFCPFTMSFIRIAAFPEKRDDEGLFPLVYFTEDKKQQTDGEAFA
jgi:hypothetical protein